MQFHANIPDTYYDPPECQTAPRGTYAHAVRLLRDELANLIHDAAIEGETLTVGVVRRRLSDCAERLSADGDEVWPIDRLDSGEWDAAVEDAIDGSRFAECAWRGGESCTVSADYCGA